MGFVAEMIRSIAGKKNTRTKIEDHQPSKEIHEFALKVFDAFNKSQTENKKSIEQKKESFLTEFEKIRQSFDLETNKNLKDEIYDDLTSNISNHLSGILGQNVVRAKTARSLRDHATNNKIDSIQIRLLIYNLRSKPEPPKENDTLSLLFWNESIVPKPSIQTSTEKSMCESSPTPPHEAISASNNKRDKVDEFEQFLKKIDPNFQITKDKYDEILSQYDDYRISEKKFETRKADTLNLDLISQLTESEKKLKNTISSCLQLPTVAVPTSSLQAPNKSDEAKEESNETISYQIKNKDFDEVLNYLKYEKIKAYYEKNPPQKNKYEHPKSNETLDNLLKSIIEIPNNILKVFDCIRTNSENGKGPPQ